MNASIAADGGWGIPLGTPVVDAAGERLGMLRAADPWVLAVERGIFFPGEYAIAMAEVDRYEDGALILKRTKQDLLGDAT